jgi:hypothetical protein
MREKETKMASNAAIPFEQPFVLLSGVNPNNAIQAASVSGSGLKLQPFDDSFGTPGQQFVLRMQNNLDPDGNLLACGMAFVNLGASMRGSNPAAFCSVASGGLEMPLTVQPYIPTSIGERMLGACMTQLHPERLASESPAPAIHAGVGAILVEMGRPATRFSCGTTRVPSQSGLLPWQTQSTWMFPARTAAAVYWKPQWLGNVPFVPSDLP